MVFETAVSYTHLELDGVRGIAILMVLVFHAFMFSLNPMTGWISKLASYGFAGVDLFFVLSGFLITGILLKAKGRPGYFRNFYAKRALRIWPLYYLLLLLSFGLVPFLILRIHVDASIVGLALPQSHSALVYVFLLQNIWYGGKLGPPTLAMTWSLAIEEQFYLVWPWLVLWLSLIHKMCIRDSDMDFPSLGSCGRRGRRPWRRCATTCGCAPVSYTHLDVYKRQA